MQYKHTFPRNYCLCCAITACAALRHPASSAKPANSPYLHHRWQDMPLLSSARGYPPCVHCCPACLLWLHTPTAIAHCYAAKHGYIGWMAGWLMKLHCPVLRRCCMSVPLASRTAPCPCGNFRAKPSAATNFDFSRLPAVRCRSTRYVAQCCTAAAWPCLDRKPYTCPHALTNPHHA